MPGVFARVGEVVVCENDHEICRVGRDLTAGETMTPRDFKYWIGRSAPELGDLVTPCVCGSDFWRPGQVHIRGRGWVPGTS